MDSKSKKRKGGSITEEDVSALLQRYSVKTVLQLLREIAISAREKIDWNAIVKNTSTGISSARECQMLWRHLAYGQTLITQIDDAANPVDDDSDLEFQVEAFPVVSRDAAVEAAAFVRVLVASNHPIDHHMTDNSTIEVPMTVNIPTIKVPSDSSTPANAMEGTNIIIPVSVPKEPLFFSTLGAKRSRNGKSGVDVLLSHERKVWSTEDDLKTKGPKDGNSRVDVPAPLKRKVGSTEDEVKLTAAVQKHGERKGANISEPCLYQAEKDNSNTGTSAAPSEDIKAANQACLLALEPRVNNLKAARQMSKVGANTTQHESLIASSPSSGNVNAPTPPLNKVAKTAEVAGVSTSASEMKEPVQRDLVAGVDNIQPKAAASIGYLSKREVDKCTSASGKTHSQGDQTSFSFSCPVSQPLDQQVALSYSETEDNGIKLGDPVTSAKEIYDPTITKGKHDDLSCKSLNVNEGSTVNTIATAGEEVNN